MSSFRACKFFLVIVFLVLFFSQISVAGNESKRDRISIVYSVDSVPFQFQDEQGQPAGMIIDLWKLWAKKTGTAIDFHPATWKESLDRVKQGKSQVHAGLFFNEERDLYLDFGAILARTDTNVFLQRNLPLIASIDELAGYQVGVLAGDYVESYLEKLLPPHSIVPYTDYAALMTALENEKLKVFAADTLAGIHHLKRSGLLNKFKIFAPISCTAMLGELPSLKAIRHFCRI